MERNTNSTHALRRLSNRNILGLAPKLPITSSSKNRSATFTPYIPSVKSQCKKRNVEEHFS